MDWHLWLSKTNLDPSLIYDYALTFSHNELDQEDIPFFNHEFLQSMGISVAKHRLEILKLSRNEKGVNVENNGMSKKMKILWLVFAVKKARKNLAEHVKGWIRRPENSAGGGGGGGGSLAVVPATARNCSRRWKAAMLKRKKTSDGYNRPSSFKEKPARMITNINGGGRKVLPATAVAGGEGRMMMLTYGSPLVDDVWGNKFSGYNSPMEDFSGAGGNEKTAAVHGGGEHWSPTVEDIKWDSMFSNLKPT